MSCITRTAFSIKTITGMLPPFAIETEEGKAMARHCTVGIEPRVSAERLIVLDTQVFLVATLVLLSMIEFPFLFFTLAAGF